MNIKNIGKHSGTILYNAIKNIKIIYLIIIISISFVYYSANYYKNAFVIEKPIVSNWVKNKFDLNNIENEILSHIQQIQTEIQNVNKSDIRLRDSNFVVPALTFSISGISSPTLKEFFTFFGIMPTSIKIYIYCTKEECENDSRTQIKIFMSGTYRYSTSFTNIMIGDYSRDLGEKISEFIYFGLSKKNLIMYLYSKNRSWDAFNNFVFNNIKPQSAYMLYYSENDESKLYYPLYCMHISEYWDYNDIHAITKRLHPNTDLESPNKSEIERISLDYFSEVVSDECRIAISVDKDSSLSNLSNALFYYRIGDIGRSREHFVVGIESVFANSCHLFTSADLFKRLNDDTNLQRSIKIIYDRYKYGLIENGISTKDQLSEIDFSEFADKNCQCTGSKLRSNQISGIRACPSRKILEYSKDKDIYYEKPF